MAKCQAGDCEVECGGGKGCGCIAESDNPANCTCICTGGDCRGGFKLETAMLVDVSTSELPLFEAAQLFNALCRERIIVPIDRMSEQASLNIKRKPLGDVLTQLDLTTKESIERDKRMRALLLFSGGLVLGLLVQTRR